MSNSKKLILIQIISFFISSVSMCFMPLGSYYDGKLQKGIAMILGVIFWIFLIAGFVLNIVIRKTDKDKNVKGRCGIIRLFQNKYAKIADVILIISFIVSVITIVSKSTIYLGAVVLFVFVFSFEMHCILNGKYFNVIFLKENNK